MSSAQNRDNKPKMSIYRFLIILTVLISFIGGTLIDLVWPTAQPKASLTFPGESLGPLPTDQANVPNSDAISLRPYNIISDVPRLAWAPDRPFSLWAIDQDKPVILTNSAVQRWAALGKWTPQYLALNTRKIPLEFKTADDPVFIYSQRKPLNRVEGLKFERPFNFTHMDLDTFWSFVNGEKVHVNDTQKYLYFTGCITRSQDQLKDLPELVADITPFSAFSVENGEHDMNLWLGSPGVVAHTHHDEVPNWGAQIYGHKRWILSPPSEAEKLYPFPHMHSFRSQSQVDFKTGKPIDKKASYQEDLFPKFGNITAYQALLSPGEILYIPPFWFHRVVTEDTSIAVNTWSNPPGGSPHDLMDLVPLPFEEDWDLARKVVALRVFFQMLGNALSESGTPDNRDPGFTLLKSQYDALFYSAFGKEDAAQFGKDLKEACWSEDLAEFEANLSEKIQNGIYISDLMDQLIKLKNMDSRRLLFLAYLESKIYLLLEDPNLLYPFIRDCLPKSGAL